MERNPPNRPSRKSRRELAGEQTRLDLVAASRALFAERGYADVSIDDITERTGVTRGALYHHFEDKRALFQAVVEQIEGELADGVRRAAEAEREPSARLRAACDAYLDACLARDVQQVVVRDGPTVLGWRAWCALDKQAALGVFEACLSDARDAGVLAVDSVETAALLLLGALNTGARVVADAADPRAARVQVGTTVDRVLGGFAARGPRAAPGGRPR